MNECMNNTVFTNGCFDILHVGHVRLLQHAAQLGDNLVVGLNSDESVARLKGSGRPINGFEDRKEILLALGCVSEVLKFPDAGKPDDPFELIKKIRPSVIVKGGDYTESEVIGAEFLRSYGGRVVIFPFVLNKSTTRIVQKLDPREI